MTEERAQFEVTHQRVTLLEMKRAEIEALVIAEAIRRAATMGVMIDLNKGSGTKAVISWWMGHATIHFCEDITP